MPPEQPLPPSTARLRPGQLSLLATERRTFTGGRTPRESLRRKGSGICCGTRQSVKEHVMPPTPKHHSVRARVNKASTRATLFEPEPGEVEVPELPPMRLVERRRKSKDDQGIVQTELYMVEVPWRLETQDWWESLWSSPMAGEFHTSDRHGLYRLAVLIDDFWQHPSTTANAEIRLAQKDYGLTPLDRRRLEWTIASAEKATETRPPRKAKGDKGTEAGPDPRLHIA